MVRRPVAGNGVPAWMMETSGEPGFRGDPPPVIAPVMPPPRPPGWIARNLKWLIPAVVIAAVVAVGLSIGVLAWTITGMMRSSGAYAGAMARVRASSGVTEAIGAPISESWWVTGNISMKAGGGGTADLTIPISGPRGRATVYVEAERIEGQWHFSVLVVVVAADHRRIDLSEPRTDEPGEPAHSGRV